jgi:hypothetical protein
MPSRFPTAVLRQCDCESNCGYSPGRSAGGGAAGEINGATPKQSDTLQGKASPRHNAISWRGFFPHPRGALSLEVRHLHMTIPRPHRGMTPFSFDEQRPLCPLTLVRPFA